MGLYKVRFTTLNKDDYLWYEVMQPNGCPCYIKENIGCMHKDDFSKRYANSIGNLGFDVAKRIKRNLQLIGENNLDVYQTG